MTGYGRRLTTATAVLALTAGSALAAFPDDPPRDPRYPPQARCPDLRGEPVSGQWNLFSDQSGCPPPAHGSGISADLAWRVTTGHPLALIAVLDSGVQYDHEDLRDKIWLNRGELPVPTGTCSAPTADPHDCNDDGVFNVEDYAGSGVPDFNATGDIDRGDLRTFANGVDDDANGYVDDLSGWDAADDDGDEFDHRFFSHGTGRAGIVAPDTDNVVPETNTGIGVAGVCPDCPVMSVRIDDTFVHWSEGVAKGAIYAVDNGAKVINMSLGGTTASRLSRDAFTYAVAHDVLPVNASANEFSPHHNFQAVFDDVMTIGAVTPDNRTSPTTWKQKANFANYGAHLDVVGPTLVPAAEQGCQRDPATGVCLDQTPVVHNAYGATASGTSSSTPHAAGVGALVFSEAIESGLNPGLSTQEVRQIINGSADDVVPGEMTPPYTPAAGWDKWSGYGRVNAKAAVDMVAATTIPPEADINSPDWYSLVDGTVTVRAYANARRASSFGYVLEVAPGVEPSDGEFTRLASANGVAAQPNVSSADLVDTVQAQWNTASLSNGLYTLRLRVTDNRGNTGEDRMAVWVRHPDPQDLPGFPKFFDGSLESLSVALVDLDGDNRLEVIFVDGNGQVHAVRSNGAELPGFPVHTNLPANLPLTTSPAFDGNAANGEVRRSWSSMFAGPAVADVDGDGEQDIVIGALDGRLYCWEADAAVCDGSWPAAADHGFTRDPYGTHQQIRESHPEAILSTPALGNLDADPQLEIVAGTVEQKLYVWNHDGSRLAPWPKEIFDPGAPTPGVSAVAPRAILATAAIADVDADGANEIVAATTETYSSPNFNGVTGGSGRAYLLEADGTIAPGWPVKPTSISPGAVPIVAEGIGTSPAVANVDADPQLEIATTVFFGDPTIYNHDGSVVRTLSGAFGATGPGSDLEEVTSEGGLARSSDQPSHFYVAQGIFGNLDGGSLEYVTGTVGNGIAVAVAAGAGSPGVFDHLVSAWDVSNGSPKPAFPRVIEDWQFVTGPAVANIGGAQSPEVIASSGGFFVHAWDSSGAEPVGWPKLTGHWQVSTPSIGDIDDDGDVEVVQPTRLGALFIWSTPGPTCQSDEWRKFHHDEWNTGVYGADTRRPAVTDDLAAAVSPNRLITLNFTAPGDDGACGSAQRYELRWVPGHVSSPSWTDGQDVGEVREMRPKPAGQGEAVTFGPFAPGDYTLMLRAFDESENGAGLAIRRVSVGDVTGDVAVPKCPGLESESGNHIVGTGLRDILEGTAGRDVICGLGEADVISGAEGDDLIAGGAGADVLIGGGGDDALDGGPGADTADYTASPSAVKVDLTSGRASGLGDDRLSGIENVIGSEHGDEVTGDPGVNRLAGGSGDDRLAGAGGDDRILGERGPDKLHGGSGADRLSGAGGNDWLRGGPQADRCAGGPGRDRLRSC